MAVTEYEEIVKPNWTQRLGGSFKGILTGIVLIVAGVGLAFWNEGRAVKTAKALDEGSKAVVSVSADKIDTANEGRLVHVSALADTKEILEDPALGVKVNAIKLKREVEIYQWVENKETETVKKDGKDYKKTTYTYSKKWCDEPIDSAAFKEAGHSNPQTLLSLDDKEFLAGDVKLGAFSLSKRNIERIGGSKAYEFESGYTVSANLKGTLVNNTIYIPASESAPAPASGANMSPLLAAAKTSSSTNAAVARDAAVNPAVGDVRIRLSVVRPHEISLCQRQSASSFAPWKAANGRMIDLQTDGVKTAEEMFESAKSGNAILTWILRALGFILVFAGFKGVFGPIAVLVDVIPVLNGIVAMGVGLIAFIFTTIVWLCTVGFAWVFYRPVLGLSLLAGAGALIVYAISKKKKPLAA